MKRIRVPASAVSLHLQAYGVTGARELAAALGVSRPTLSRLVTSLGPAIERVGAGRATSYGLRRNVGNLGSEFPLYRMSPTGRIQPWGRLRALHRAFRFFPADHDHPWCRRLGNGVSDGLPFFLHDLRPQGFVGRAIARQLAVSGGYPPDPRLWTDDHNLLYFATEGYDLPGDVILGDLAMERAAGGGFGDTLHLSDRATHYPKLIEAVQRGEHVGSSAGGEQPKFLVTLSEGTSTRSLIVKYSPRMDSAAGRRWAELLVCEHIAASVMKEKQVDAALTNIVRVDERLFLEVERYDRTSQNGRKGLVTLGVVEDEFLPQASMDWSDAAGLLLQAGLVDDASARRLRWTWCFGDLIANTDMHRSNACFWFDAAEHLQLAPSYDMLPMLYIPNSQGEVLPRQFNPKPPRLHVADVWADAASAAVTFWSRVAVNERISEEFRTIAARNSEKVAALASRHGATP